jgi:hypothetical protein
MWELPVSAGIEIKYWQIEARVRQAVHGLCSDIEKLDLFQRERPQYPGFLGVVLCVVQSRHPKLSNDLWDCMKDFGAEGVMIPTSGLVAIVVATGPRRTWTIKDALNWRSTIPRP